MRLCATSTKNFYKARTSVLTRLKPQGGENRSTGLKLKNDVLILCEESQAGEDGAHTMQVSNLHHPVTRNPNNFPLGVLSPPRPFLLKNFAPADDRPPANRRFNYM